MGKRTGKPKGRPAGSPNKRTIGVDAFLAKGGLSQPEDDFDVLVHMKNLAKSTLEQFYKERRKESPNAAILKDFEERARLALKDYAPYKYPKLASLKVDGVMKHDLSQLTDAELLSLRRIVGKTAID